MYNRHAIDKIIVQHIILWIEDNIESIIKIEDVANIAGYCRRNIQLIFKRYVHMSLGEYIRRRKIARAAALLKTSALNLIDVSVRLHFDSQQSFTREFKKILGVPPQKYRNRNYWDLPYLCPPYIWGKAISFSFLELSEMVLTTDMILDRHSCRSRKETIMNYIDKHKTDVYCISGYGLQQKIGDLDYRDKYIATRNNEKAYGKKITTPPGLYAKFLYKGTWRDFLRLPKYLYLTLLPAHGLAHMDACDIIHIPYSNAGLAKNNEIECTYYIPVRWM
ncbi:TPA: helix-turn-helix domain-containing protein [Escherichia coli]|nr:helix-turn-helix domain-containing protein [Escherichia coli]